MSTTDPTHAVFCQRCSEPAVYQLRGEHHEEHCEACAIRFGYERRGESYMAVKTLGFAIALLRECEIDDALILAIVHDTMNDPHSDGSYPIGGDHRIPGPDRVADRPWMTPFEAIAGED